MNEANHVYMLLDTSLKDNHSTNSNTKVDTKIGFEHLSNYILKCPLFSSSLGTTI